MTKSMARNELEASKVTAARQEAMEYKVDVLGQEMGDMRKEMSGIKDQLNRMEILVQRLVNSQARVVEARNMKDLRQSNLESIQGIQLMRTPEGNFKFPPTGPSVVVTGWDVDPLPHAFVASPTLNNLNPNSEPDLARQWKSYSSNDRVHSFYKSLAKGPKIDSPEFNGVEPLLEAAVQKKETTMKPFTPGVCKYCGYKGFSGHKCKHTIGFIELKQDLAVVPINSTLIHEVKLVSTVKDKESVCALAMNYTGSLLVTGDTERVVRIWDPGSKSKNMKWGRIETSGHMLSFNVVTEDNVEIVSPQAEAERQLMQISVKISSVGKNIKLNVKKSNSAVDVKEEIERKVGLLMSKQILLYTDCQLEDNQMLSQCDWRNGQTLPVLVCPTDKLCNFVNVRGERIISRDVKCCCTVAEFLRPGVEVKHYKEGVVSSVFWFSFGGKQSYTHKNATQDTIVREPHLYAFSVRNRGLEELKLQLEVFSSCVVLRLSRSRYGAHFNMKQGAVLYNLEAQMLPKNHHCYFIRLTLEYFKFSSLDSYEFSACKFNNPNHRPYVILSKHITAVYIIYGAILMRQPVEFNPLQLNAVYCSEGKTGYAVVLFTKDWNETNPKGKYIYGWLAKEEDYKSGDPVGRFLSENGDLKVVVDLEHDLSRKTDNLTISLTNQITAKSKYLLDLECKCNQMNLSLQMAMEEIPEQPSAEEHHTSEEENPEVNSEQEMKDETATTIPEEQMDENLFSSSSFEEDESEKSDVTHAEASHKDVTSVHQSPVEDEQESMSRYSNTGGTKEIDNELSKAVRPEKSVRTIEDFEAWQRIIRLDAVRANDEWISYCPTQAAVSRENTIEYAKAVCLKDYEHLESHRIHHASCLVAILEAYAIYDLPAPLLAVLEEDDEVFWCLAGFMRKANHNFRLDEVGICRQLNMVSKIIKHKDFHLYRHLEMLQAKDCNSNPVSPVLGQSSSVEPLKEPIVNQKLNGVNNGPPLHLLQGSFGERKASAKDKHKFFELLRSQPLNGSGASIESSSSLIDEQQNSCLDWSLFNSGIKCTENGSSSCEEANSCGGYQQHLSDNEEMKPHLEHPDVFDEGSQGILFDHSDTNILSDLADTEDVVSIEPQADYAEDTLSIIPADINDCSTRSNSDDDEANLLLDPMGAGEDEPYSAQEKPSPEEMAFLLCLGCELLKNLALMGVSCGHKGTLILTQDDFIEKSNWSRQFVFRDWNIGLAKSIVAAVAASATNSCLHIDALQNRACPETEHVFPMHSGRPLILSLMQLITSRLGCIWYCLGFLINILEGKYVAKGEGMSEPGNLKELEEALESEEF